MTNCIENCNFFAMTMKYDISDCTTLFGYQDCSRLFSYSHVLFEEFLGYGLFFEFFFEELFLLVSLKGFLLAVHKEFQSSDLYQYMVLISTLSSFSQLVRPSIGFVLLTSRISGTVKSPGKE